MHNAHIDIVMPKNFEYTIVQLREDGLQNSNMKNQMGVLAQKLVLNFYSSRQCQWMYVDLC